MVAKIGSSCVKSNAEIKKPSQEKKDGS